MDDERDIDDPARVYRQVLPPARTLRQTIRRSHFPTWAEARGYLILDGWRASADDVSKWFKEKLCARIKRPPGMTAVKIVYSKRKRQ